MLLSGQALEVEMHKVGMNIELCPDSSGFFYWKKFRTEFHNLFGPLDRSRLLNLLPEAVET